MKELFTFDGILSLVQNINHNHRQLKWFYCFYTVYQTYSILLFIRNILFLTFCKNHDDVEEWLYVDAFVYYFHVETMVGQKLLVLCCLALLIYGSLVVHYTFFDLYSYEYRLMDELRQVIIALGKAQLNVQFFLHNTREDIRTKLNYLAEVIKIDSNTFMNIEGKLNYIYKLLIAEYFYVLFNIVVCKLSAFCLSVH